MLIAEQLAASGQPSFASLPAPLPAHTTLSPPRAAATFGTNLGLPQSFPGISGVQHTAYMDTLTQLQQNIAGQAAAAYKLSVPKVCCRDRCTLSLRVHKALFHCLVFYEGMLFQLSLVWKRSQFPDISFKRVLFTFYFQLQGMSLHFQTSVGL